MTSDLYYGILLLISSAVILLALLGFVVLSIVAWQKRRGWSAGLMMASMALSVAFQIASFFLQNSPSRAAAPGLPMWVNSLPGLFFLAFTISLSCYIWQRTGHERSREL